MLRGMKTYHQTKELSTEFAYPIKQAQNAEIAFITLVASVLHQSAKNALNWSRNAVCFISFTQTSECGVIFCLL